MAELEQVHPEFLDQWDFANAAGSQARFEAEIARLTPQQSRSAYIQLLSQIARAEGLQGHLSAAHVRLDEAESLLEGHDLPAARLRCVLERGRLHHSLAHSAAARRTDAARDCYRDVLSESEQLGLDELAVDAAHMLAIVDDQSRLDWNLRAIGIARASTSPPARRRLGSLYNNAGWSYHEQGDFVSALDMFENAYAFQRAHGGPEAVLVARWCVGRCFRSLGRLDLSLTIQQELSAAYADGDIPEPGFVAEELAECLLALGRVEESRPWFAQAHRRLATHAAWLLESDPPRMARLAELGRQERD